MVLITQPKDSKICGHCSVAMVSGIPLKEVIDIIGHENGTYGVDLVKVLNKHNINNSGRLKFPVPETLPNKCILRIKFEGKAQGHFVAYYNGFIYDPSFPCEVEVNHYKDEFLWGESKFISYIKVN